MSGDAVEMEYEATHWLVWEGMWGFDIHPIKPVPPRGRGWRVIKIHVQRSEDTDTWAVAYWERPRPQRKKK